MKTTILTMACLAALSFSACNNDTNDETIEKETVIIKEEAPKDDGDKINFNIKKDKDGVGVEVGGEIKDDDDK